MFTLTEDVLEDYFEMSKVYAYYVTGLRTDDVDSPCDTTTSRWLKVREDFFETHLSNKTLTLKITPPPPPRPALLELWGCIRLWINLH